VIFLIKIRQIQPEVIALLAQRYCTSTGSETYDGKQWTRVCIGSEVPEPIYVSCVLIGKNVNKKELRLFIRKLMITSEDFEVLLGGDKYGSIKFKGIALKDDDPETHNSEWPYDDSVSDCYDDIAFFAWEA
jgi:hypothetical protein